MAQRDDGMKGRGDEEHEGGKEYLLAYIADTLETFHSLTSLLKLSAYQNTVERKMSRTERMKKKQEDSVAHLL